MKHVNKKSEVGVSLVVSIGFSMLGFIIIPKNMLSNIKRYIMTATDQMNTNHLPDRPPVTCPALPNQSGKDPSSKLETNKNILYFIY